MASYLAGVTSSGPHIRFFTHGLPPAGFARLESFQIRPVNAGEWNPVQELSMLKSWIFLGVAIVAEVVATSGLKASEGFTRLWPSLLVIAGYSVAFYFLSISLKDIPVGLAYAIWAGLGIVLVALIGWLIYGQTLDAASVIGMAMIIGGVAVINVFSKTAVH